MQLFVLTYLFYLLKKSQKNRRLSFVHIKHYKHMLFNISYCPFYMSLAFLGFLSWPTLTFYIL